MTLREKLVAQEMEDILLADGFDSAFIGIGSRCGQPDVAVYDVGKCIEALVADWMSYEEAVEYFDFNVVGAWVGPRTPIYMRQLEGEPS